MTHRHALFFESLKSSPVIAGLRDAAGVEAAIQRGVAVLFILGEDIFALQESVAKAHAHGRLIFAHVDLIKGLGRDDAGVRFLGRSVGVDGVLTTRANLIGAAKKEGLIAIQRLFVLDSESLEAGLPTVERSAPDAVEILPGVILPAIAPQLASRAALPPLIAGGLIRSQAQAEAVLAAGALAVSTSALALWGYRRVPDGGARAADSRGGGRTP